ncbi:hypothetical protein [Burkholderia sp. Ac-20365]|uniref:hypothetical protein n=1 Tax=Burkholderia sp. Ac-20365 TaxID=2703897 RepID=UPI00197B0B2A|nr:hypothetical protein [Burkholderia sp. Ac-20365]
MITLEQVRVAASNLGGFGARPDEHDYIVACEMAAARGFLEVRRVSPVVRREFWVASPLPAAKRAPPPANSTIERDQPIGYRVQSQKNSSPD